MYKILLITVLLLHIKLKEKNPRSNKWVDFIKKKKKSSASIIRSILLLLCLLSCHKLLLHLFQEPLFGTSGTHDLLWKFHVLKHRFRLAQWQSQEGSLSVGTAQTNNSGKLLMHVCPWQGDGQTLATGLNHDLGNIRKYTFVSPIWRN